MNQDDTLELLRSHPRSTVAELADLVSDRKDHHALVMVKQNIQGNLHRLLEKGQVSRTWWTKPYRWSVEE